MSSTQLTSLGASLDYEWMDWREWAKELIETHSSSQVADSIADLGEQVNALRKAMAAEARIIDAQTLSLSSRALGKGRREIVTKQVRRMYGVALAKCPPRSFGRGGRDWREQVAQLLEAVDG